MNYEVKAGKQILCRDMNLYAKNLTSLVHAFQQGRGPNLTSASQNRGWLCEVYFSSICILLPDHFDHLTKVGRLENQKNMKALAMLNQQSPRNSHVFIASSSSFFFLNSSKQLLVICCSNLLLRSGECFGPFYWVGRIKM